ncbi:hypothetical protein [Taibaiella soli]|uniref:Porin n=1 Tax=Taibaiella soli TaxID=1649169 RepID=A0A2W2AUN8_9BACT|nr:hypothetical protein [Taibaiella soli]PZF71398.1 hypothetical protein DN068_19100 [Taibaiella soli]
MKKIISVFVVLVFSLSAFAQNHMHHGSDSSMHMMPGMNMDHAMPMDHSKMEMPSMSSAFSPNLPMTRNGSGTSWLPDASPMYAYMVHSKKWMFMFHGDVFIRYNHQDIGSKGSRGGEKWDAPNMLMAMGQRKVGKNGLFHFSAMFSLDAAIAGGSGYPLLFQSGETWDGKPLVDRQHPHDLFSELSVSYAHAFSKKADAFIYVGYPGEPALGPVTFMHRPSGMDNPDAPIGHHWEDATHITFGVATVGFRYGKFRIEGSSFTGREPDENRYNFDKPLFDSRSARLSFNPNREWALQVSHGFIKSPEALHPDEDVYRTTASATYSHQFAKATYFNATALWGMNKIKEHDGENAALLEGSLHINRTAVYGRYEWVQKSVEELNLDETVYGHDALFPVNVATLGAAYDLFHIGPIRIAGGGQMSMYFADSKLDNLYGKNPIAGEVYLRIYPGLMK